MNIMQSLGLIGLEYCVEEYRKPWNLEDALFTLLCKWIFIALELSVSNFNTLFI
jgi:hypothetical protein